MVQRNEKKSKASGWHDANFNRERGGADSGGRGERGQSLVEFSLILPIIMVLLLGVADLARVYTTLTNLGAAAREAADFGAFKSANWTGLVSDPDSNRTKTLNAMNERACIATQHMTDYVGTTTTCTNPRVTISLTESDGTAATNCDDPDRIQGPCWVQVDLDYTFGLLVPFAIEFGGTRLGLPETYSISKTSIFAMSDFELDLV